MTPTTITQLWSKGGVGSGTGQFNKPWDVTYDGTGASPRLLVADSANSRIVALGKPALPLLIRDLERGEFLLNDAVHRITGIDVVKVVHGQAFDNVTLRLAATCAEEGRWEFLFVTAPLRLPRGTGSPVNPLAIF